MSQIAVPPQLASTRPSPLRRLPAQDEGAVRVAPPAAVRPQGVVPPATPGRVRRAARSIATALRPTRAARAELAFDRLAAQDARLAALQVHARTMLAAR